MVIAIGLWLAFLGETSAQETSASVAGNARYGSPQEREFDFWIGEWSVVNRDPTPNGGFEDRGTADARVRPILGGKALLEEWDGKTGKYADVFGISLRCFDPNTSKLGTVVVAIHDTPFEDLTEFSITITGISLIGSEATGPKDRVTVFPPAADPALTKTVNLLELAELAELVVVEEVPFDFYHTVVFSFENAAAKAGEEEVTVTPE